MQYSTLSLAFASTAMAQVYGSLTAAPIAPTAPVYGAPSSLAAAPIIPAPFPSSNLTAQPIFPTGNSTGQPLPLPIQTSDLTTYTTVCPITTCYTNGGIPTTTVITITSTITTCVKCIGVPGATAPGAAPPAYTGPGAGLPTAPGSGSPTAPAGGSPGSNGGGSGGVPGAGGNNNNASNFPKVSATAPGAMFTGAAIALKPAGALVAGAAAAVALL